MDQRSRSNDILAYATGKIFDGAQDTTFDNQVPVWGRAHHLFFTPGFP